MVNKDTKWTVINQSLNTDNYNFTAAQKREIERGVQAGLDITVYAKEEYDSDVMRLIRYGMQTGIDMTPYVEEYDPEQMLEILNALEKEIDISIISNPEYSASDMRSIIECYNAHIDIDDYINKDTPKDAIEYICDILLNGEDASMFEGITQSGYGETIFMAIKQGVDITPYLHRDLSDGTLRQVFYYLKEGFDIDPYLEYTTDDYSLSVILTGLNRGIDFIAYMAKCDTQDDYLAVVYAEEKGVSVDDYLGKGFVYFQFIEIIDGLAEGFDVAEYADISITANNMKGIRLAMKDGSDYSVFLNGSYNKEQLDIMSSSLAKGFNIIPYMKPVYGKSTIQIIRDCMIAGVDMSYMKEDFSDYIAFNESMSRYRSEFVNKHRDMWFYGQVVDVIYYGLTLGVNIVPYITPEFSVEQINALISLKHYHDVDLSKYAKLEYTEPILLILLNGLRDGADLLQYAEKGYDEYTLRALSMAIPNSIDITPYLSGYRTDALNMFVSAKVDGVDLTRYFEEGYSADQLFIIFTAIINGCDVSLYADKNMSESQMRELLKYQISRYGRAHMNHPLFDEEELLEDIKRVKESLGIDYCDEYCIAAIADYDIGQVELEPLLERLKTDTPLKVFMDLCIEQKFYDFLYEVRKGEMLSDWN